MKCFKAFLDSIKNRNRVKRNKSRIDKECMLLVNIQDILDEINILRLISNEQHQMMKSLLSWVESRNGKASKGEEGKGPQKWEEFVLNFRL
jgi:hypothetical protein